MSLRAFCDVLHECISKSLREFFDPCFDASVLFEGVSKQFLLCVVVLFVEKMLIAVRLRR